MFINSNKNFYDTMYKPKNCQILTFVIHYKKLFINKVIHDFTFKNLGILILNKMESINDKICRTCLTESNNKNSIFGNITFNDETVSISSMIKLFTNIEVNNSYSIS